ncbi:MAG: response regulator [Gemmatimonadetes bacterium]|nr:response regulator [Candidatus Palauibacter rhopaloidicola]
MRDRFVRLTSAVLRINSSLDLTNVLQEVVDSARALTGARLGVITTIDKQGQLRDFLTSGFALDTQRTMTAWPDGLRLFEHLRDHLEPFRFSDFPGHLRSRGFCPTPWIPRVFQGAPMHHRGEHLGHFFLGEKRNGEEFTAEDEEILTLFAAQAATAIANARTHRDVERARADLEALVETTPVGVVVFDAGTGHAVSFNREAQRIADEIRTPGCPTEQLLEVMTCRHADGREYSLAEIPLARQLEGATATRAEEIELSVPDGRRVRTLVNATPIHSESGEVVSVVVTMQDLAPLEELERQRADFLSMVSHELRAPLTSIKGSAATVLEASPVPSRAEMLQFFRLINGQANHMRGLIANLLDAGSIEAGTLTVAPEPSNVASLVDQARTTFLSGGGRHPVLIDLPADLPRAMADPERIVQVLVNLFANAGRHAPESTPIQVEAARDGTHLAISVSDQGRGIAPERLPHLFRKRVGLAGGTGLGLAICKGLVEAHGGRIRAESDGPGRGARFMFTLPVAGETTADSRGSYRRPTSERRERTRVLVVDDDPLMLRFVRDALATADYAAVMTGDPQELSHLIRAEQPELVVLDLMLPGTDGIELMERTPELADLPVIFISGYRRDETIAKALELGAADYIVKPFSPTELVARVRAALRRQVHAKPFVLDELHIDYDRRRVTMAGREVALTATEYELLRVLSRNAGRVVTYNRLLRQVWGRRGGGNAGPVRTFAKNLRQKLGDGAAHPTYILTQRGVGYRMPMPDTQESP